MEDRIHNIETITQDLEKVIYGNGQPGLIEKLQKLHEQFAVRSTELRRLEKDFAAAIADLKRQIAEKAKDNSDFIKWIIVLLISIASLVKDFIIN